MELVIGGIAIWAGCSVLVYGMCVGDLHHIRMTSFARVPEEGQRRWLETWPETRNRALLESVGGPLSLFACIMIRVTDRRRTHSASYLRWRA